MHKDELFPLDAVPCRARTAILQEFDGRQPNLLEVEQIPDKQWLTAPGIGPTALACIRDATNSQQWRDVPVHSSILAILTDAELVKRVEFLQQELNSLYKVLKTKLDGNVDGRETHGGGT
jgi:hypothetical protein